ncbi:hypothetical protein [Wolbachia endosymbiont (group B) of Limnophora tigrina]|uniref:hypothetical protein n=1 Tax=Wolbachia endosymbiont (group B) of Limnophora tigrina TaxID=3139317 RepID=UPI0035B55B5A
MNTTVEKNNPEIFPKNEGKINSKGMVAPPVPPKSSQAKFAGRRAIFEQNGTPKQPAKNTSDNLERTFCPRMQDLMKNHNIDIHESTNKLNAREKADSTAPKPNVMEEKKVTLAAGDKLETVKFLETLSKKERENFGFSPKQQNNQKVETSKKTYNPLDWNPIYQGKKRFSLDNMSSNLSSCSEKSNISDISDKSNNSNIVRCNITRSNSVKDKI